MAACCSPNSGIRLTILTQAEPDDGLTDMRKAARARYGVDTLIIGDDGFAFVEVIKTTSGRCGLGGVGWIVRRSRGVPVEFFGHPFESVACRSRTGPARPGCALVGVTIVRRPEGYAVKVLPGVCL